MQRPEMLNEPSTVTVEGHRWLTERARRVSSTFVSISVHVFGDEVILEWLEGLPILSPICRSVRAKPTAVVAGTASSNNRLLSERRSCGRSCGRSNERRCYVERTSLVISNIVERLRDRNVTFRWAVVGDCRIRITCPCVSLCGSFRC